MARRPHDVDASPLRPAPSARSVRSARSTRAIVTFLFIASVGLGACGSSSATASPVGSWTLSSYTYRDRTVTASTPAATVTFTTDGKVTGTTGCNDFGGRWSTKGTELRFTAVGLTSKACNDKDGSLTAQESIMEIAFSKPQTFAIDGDRLTISAPDGAITATFTRD